MKQILIITKGNLRLIFTDIYFLLTLIVAIGLVVFKFPDFSLPYFSDELWVYGPSVRKMAEVGPSLLPNSLGIEDHWGHPMLFFFLGGLWSIIFGSSIFSTHIFAVTISIILLLSTYFVGKGLFSKKVGFFTVLILASQSIFLGQFSLVLPEILLTLFTLLTVYFFQKQKVWLYLIFSTCLVLTKESGIFPIIAITIWSLIRDIFYEKKHLKFQEYAKKYFLLGLPLLALVAHVVMLKLAYGWFVMPVRVETFELSWDIYRERLMQSMHYVFINQGRKPMVIILFLVAIFFNKKYPLYKRALIMLVAFSVMKIFFKYWKLPDFFSMLIVPLLYFGILKIVFLDVYKTDKKQGDVIAIFSIFITIYLLFSSAQFDSLRYLMCVVPLYIMIMLFFVEKSFSKNKIVMPVLVAVSIGFSSYYISYDTNAGDDTLNYTNNCTIKLDAVRYLEKHNYYNKRIYAPFLFHHAITRPLAGYLKSDIVFDNVRGIGGLNSSDLNDCIYVFESEEKLTLYNAIKENNTFELIHRGEKGVLWIEIYIRK